MKDKLFNRECPIHGFTEFRMYRKRKDNSEYLRCILCLREKLNNRGKTRKESPKIIEKVCKKHGLTKFRWNGTNKNTLKCYYRCILCRRETDNARSKLHRDNMKLQ